MPKLDILAGLMLMPSFSGGQAQFSSKSAICKRTNQQDPRALLVMDRIPNLDLKKDSHESDSNPSPEKIRPNPKKDS
jgi:hypothetical protein